jgi:hypothetical protein
MVPIRALARWLVSTAARRTTEDTRSWAMAMQRELEFIESDWAALGWALGSTTALCRRSFSGQLRRWLDGGAGDGTASAKLGKRITAPVLGTTAAAAVLIVCVLALWSLIHMAGLGPAQAKLAERVLIVVLPESVYLCSVVAFWRSRRSVALGIAAAGVVLITHAMVHYATH